MVRVDANFRITDMDKEIQKLNDDSVAQVAWDHPCIHEFIFVAGRISRYNKHVCKICEFTMTDSERTKYQEFMENGNG